MCGLIGLFSTTGVIQKTQIHSALKSLHHRGPDHSSYWHSKNKKIALGHTRLSIIDLHSGNQPISSANEHLQLIANGEFYDFEKIRADLIHQGYTFKTHSDSEIALHLYAQYGTQCLAHLRGEFAFCLWDEDNQTLFAARDRVGIKPLFYAFYNNTLYLASEIKAIIAAGVPAKWDQESYISRAFQYRDRTLFQGIHQIPPGHFMQATNDQIRITKYWDFNYPKTTCGKTKQEYSSDSTLIKQVRESLLNAVETRLRADVPVAVYLSGGLDSCSILGMAAQLSSQTLNTFTLSFDDEAYDEADIALQMAKKVGANAHVIQVNSDDLADNFASTIWHSETICINSHTVAKYLLSRYVANSGFKVVLTGEGADEIFAGYPFFRLDLLNKNENHSNSHDKAKLFSNNSISAGSLLPSEDVSSDKLSLIQRILSSTPSWLLPQIEIIEKIHTLLSHKISKQYGSINALEQFINHQDINNQLIDIDPVHQSMYLLSKSMLPNYILTLLGDRVEMAHSIEGRVPFLDHKIIEQLIHIPIELKIKNMNEKYILREACKPFITETVYQREKHPFLAPPALFNPQKKLFQLMQDTLRSNHLSSLPFFNHTKVISLLDSVATLNRKEQTTLEPIVMELLSLCILHDEYSMSS